MACESEQEYHKTQNESAYLMQKHVDSSAMVVLSPTETAHKNAQRKQLGDKHNKHEVCNDGNSQTGCNQ